MIGREPNTFLPKVNNTFGWRTTPASDNITYSVLNMLAGGGGQFGSFTLNDSVIRVDSLKRFGIDFSQFDHEAQCSYFLGSEFGSQVALFRNYRYYHTGGNSSTMITR